MRIGLIVIVLLGMAATSDAQVYQTQSGTILASGRYKGENVVAVSNHLYMNLNYEQAGIHLRLMVPTFVTKNDSLNELIHKLVGHQLPYNGKMNIASVQTVNHPKQEFITQGILFLNGISNPFSFSSVLEHFLRGNIRCTLSGEFIVNLNQFNMNNLLPGEAKVIVKFNQLVLKKAGE